MASKIIYERFLWFHNQAKEGRYPNTGMLAMKFEISRKTAQRDVSFMINRLFAPLVYVPEKRGFMYEDASYELPGSWLSEEELTSLIVSYRLASTIPDKALKTSLKGFLGQILSLHSRKGSISVTGLSEKVSVKNIEYSLSEGRIFQQGLDALLQDRPVSIEYYSPHNKESTLRDILPLHLLHYMGSWHIIAHCALRGEIRDFALSRIRMIRPCDAVISAEVAASSIKEYIRENFGILSGNEISEVCIRFSAEIAPWIAEQVWHPRQKAEKAPDGSLCLSFPVADFREIKREILKHGSHAEVVSPAGLRDEVKEEIEKMKDLYW